jgi:serine/threonine protein kinase
MKTLDDWPRVKRVLDGALACEDADRAAYLEHACGPDQSLRFQVETLLAARERASTFLETPAVLLLEERHSRANLSGLTVGSYRLTSRLGAGGSGDVYLARDTRLDRDVALKVLPEALAADGERIARFKREAQLLASLNHPNIAAIYGFEESGAIRALVLELVEGSTLADRIAQGSLPVDEALPIARQIVEAVEAAHGRGIIHRDLKPANIKLRPDGTVKVLDFGLAKVLESDAAGGSRSTLPGRTPDATTIGLILGTPSYMSPEQARGKVADKRTDVWAFGCLLYEMLTGRRPFAGDNTAEILAQILTHEPDFGSLPATTPVPVRRLLRRCLDKDSARRLPDIGVARIEIDDAIAAPHVVAESTSRMSARRARFPGSARQRWLSPRSAALSCTCFPRRQNRALS